MKIISHRGSGVNYKPNTKEAILKALSTNYIDGVEFDVRITKDQKIVIIHDFIIDFVSNGRGIVKNLTYKKLLKYNFGDSKNPSKIATLDEVLKEISSNKIVLIELKEESNEYKEFVDIVYSIISKYKLNIYVASFNYELIKYFKTKYNKCGIIIGLGINSNKLYNHFDFNIVSTNYKNRVDKKETFIWTVNKYIENIKKYNIITDKPYLFNEKKGEK